MSHAFVCRLTDVQKHPNADRLQVALALGSRVVVGPTTKEGDLVLFFPADVQLSHDYCEKNGLYRKQDESGKQIGGFFEPDRRVRCLSMRGVKTEGYVANLATLEPFAKTTDLREGDKINAWGGVKICEKYLTRATRLRRDAKPRSSTLRLEPASLPKHFDTEPLKRMLSLLPEKPGLVVITEKLHGTSGRTGRVAFPSIAPPSFWQNPLRWAAWHLYHKLYGLVPPPYLTDDRVITGSRNVLFLDSLADAKGSYYGDESFREDVVKNASVCMNKGESWYYEIVGFLPKRGDESGDTLRPIMPSQPTSRTKDKEITHYGEKMTYSYGCKPHEAKAFVYRITEQVGSSDSPPRDLPYLAMVARCAQVGLATPPLVTPIVWTQNVKAALASLDLETLASGPSLLDPSHIREGVCVRVEVLGEDGIRIYKVKSHAFGVLEGYAKDNDDYCDTEESA